MISAWTSDADSNLSNFLPQEQQQQKKKAGTVAGHENKAIGGKSIIPAPVLSDARVPALWNWPGPGSLRKSVTQLSAPKSDVNYHSVTQNFTSH